MEVTPVAADPVVPRDERTISSHPPQLREVIAIPFRMFQMQCLFVGIKSRSSRSILRIPSYSEIGIRMPVVPMLVMLVVMTQTLSLARRG